MIGGNGVGKTTCLNNMRFRQRIQRHIKINPSVKVGYFAQELDNLNNEATILDDV